jgi:hypothetical protein
MTARRIASGIVLVAALGLLAGYVGAWIEFRNELAHGASYVKHEYTLFVFPALPGIIIAQHFSPDWRLQEVWQHRHLIASANGLFWFGVAGVIYLLRFIFLPRTTPPSIIADH